MVALLSNAPLTHAKEFSLTGRFLLDGKQCEGMTQRRGLFTPGPIIKKGKEEAKKTISIEMGYEKTSLLLTSVNLFSLSLYLETH